MQMFPEQMAKTLIVEAFQSRRLVVGMFVLVNGGDASRRSPVPQGLFRVDQHSH